MLIKRYDDQFSKIDHQSIINNNKLNNFKKSCQ